MGWRSSDGRAQVRDPSSRPAKILGERSSPPERPKYEDESDIGLYRALQSLRQPLCFDALVGYGYGFSPQEDPASVTTTGFGGCSSAAMSGHVMRGGRHFVEFTMANCDEESVHYNHLGVIRPVSLTDGIDLRAEWGGYVNPMLVSSCYKSAIAEKLRSQRRTTKWGDGNVHCCAYYCDTGKRYSTDWDNEQDIADWQGSEGFTGSGTVRLLLDLDEGTLSMFKNGRRLGVMKTGLSGEYCWFVSVCSSCTISLLKGQVPNSS